MRLSSSVPKSFWDEAVMTVYYVTNMTSFATLSGDTLYEIWYDRCVDYFILRALVVLLSFIKVGEKQNLKLRILSS